MSDLDFNIHGVRRRPWQEGLNYFMEAYSWPPGADLPCYVMAAWNEITGERYVAKMEGLKPPMTKAKIEEARRTMQELLRGALTGKEDQVMGPPVEIIVKGHNKTGPIVLRSEGHA